MQKQEKMVEAKKEEALQKAATKEEDLANKVNVLNIAVDDDFDVDDIWNTAY